MNKEKSANDLSMRGTSTITVTSELGTKRHREQQNISE
jgi:hypothetical protein